MSDVRVGTFVMFTNNAGVQHLAKIKDLTEEVAELESCYVRSVVHPSWEEVSKFLKKNKIAVPKQLIVEIKDTTPISTEQLDDMLSLYFPEVDLYP